MNPLQASQLQSSDMKGPNDGFYDVIATFKERAVRDSILSIPGNNVGRTEEKRDLESVHR